MCEKRPLLQRQRGKTVGLMLSWCELASLSMATVNWHSSFHIMTAQRILESFPVKGKDVWILIRRSQTQEFMAQ